jgi:hypothetical protein
MQRTPPVQAHGETVPVPLAGTEASRSAAPAPVPPLRAADPPGPPALPQLVIRVAVTGHRPNQLDDDTSGIERSVDHVLTHIRALAAQIVARRAAGYAETPPRLVVVSSLAEGADRLVAHAGRRLGYRLEVPLPFAESVYVEDFEEPSSREEFEELVGNASAVLELDGDRTDEGLAYDRVGRVTIANCDVLVMIWNGVETDRVGGTWAVGTEAMRQGVPVVCIPTQAPNDAVLLDPHGDRKPLEALDDVLRKILEQPARGKLYESYFQPVPLGGRSPRLFVGFRKLMLWGTRVPRESGPEAAEPGIGEEAGEGQVAGPPPDPDWGDYRWADELANVYGNYHRSAYLVNFGLGALAVLLALLSLPGMIPFSSWFAVGELALITAIIGVTWLGQRRQWHDRWLNHRLLAEQFRQADLLVPLGRTGAWFRGLVYALAPRPGEPWTTWLFRARVREAGLTLRVPRVELSRPFLDAYGVRLRSVIAAQRSYHHENHWRMHKLDHRLHRAGYVLFGLTLIACVVHIVAPSVLHHGHLLEVVEFWAVVAAAVLPALGAALAAIASQGEFRRISRRSAAMRRHLAELEAQTVAAREGSSDQYAQVAEQATQLMTAELLDWHVMLLERPLVLPA